MQIYATSDLGNHVKSFKKSFADRGYKTKASVEGNTVMATDSSLLMIIYDSEYNCTYVMYVSPELSRELLEDGYTPEDLFEIADEYL